MTDGLGNEVRLERPARRIIALYGAFNEIIAEMGLGGRLVARTKADAGIPAVAHLPSVGTHMRPNLEMVVGLKPDLVLQLTARKGASVPVEALRREGIPVAEFNPHTFGELFEAIRAIGVLTGAPEAAAALAGRMHTRLDAVADMVARRDETPRVFFEIRSPSLLAAGRGGIVNDVIERAGGVNAVSDPKKIVRLGEEALHGLDPDVYLVQRGPMNPDPRPLDERPLYEALRAVRLGRTLVVDEGAFSRPGPRAVEAVERLAHYLHPNLMQN